MDYKVWRELHKDVINAKMADAKIAATREDNSISGFPITDEVKATCDRLRIGSLACLSNGRLLRMMYNFNSARGRGNNTKLIDNISKLVSEHEDYFTEFRKHYGLDYSRGWLHRYIKKYTRRKISKRYLWFITGLIVGLIVGLVIGCLI